MLTLLLLILIIKSNTQPQNSSSISCTDYVNIPRSLNDCINYNATLSLNRPSTCCFMKMNETYPKKDIPSACVPIELFNLSKEKMNFSKINISFPDGNSFYGDLFCRSNWLVFKVGFVVFSMLVMS